MSPPLEPGTPGDIQPPAQHVPGFPDRDLLSPDRVDWSAGWKACILAGVLMMMATFFLLPFLNIGAFLLVIAGGAIAVNFYQRRRPIHPITAGMGARLGVVSGLLGFVMLALLTVGTLAIEIFAFHKGGELRDELRDQLRQAVEANPSPNAQQAAQWIMTPEGLATVVTLSLVIFLIGFLIFGTLGGALGAAIFGKRDPGQH